MALQAAQEAHGLSVVTRVPTQVVMAAGPSRCSLPAPDRAEPRWLADSLSRGRDDGDHGANVRAG